MSEHQLIILKRLDDNDTLAKSLLADCYRLNHQKGVQEMQKILDQNEQTRKALKQGVIIKE